jgi:hypothetical protein
MVSIQAIPTSTRKLTSGGRSHQAVIGNNDRLVPLKIYKM